MKTAACGFRQQLAVADDSFRTKTAACGFRQQHVLADDSLWFQTAVFFNLFVNLNIGPQS
jgi:hypothetical protein